MTDVNNDNNNLPFKWTTHPTTLLTARSYLSTVAIDDHRIIITGGYNHDYPYLSSAELFDSRSDGDKAEQLPPMNQGRLFHSSIYMDGFVYVIGGYFNPAERISTNNLGSSSTWETLEDMQQKRSNFAVAEYNNYIYAFGGRINGDSSNMVERYVVSNNTWETIKPMNQTRYDHAAMTVRDMVFVFGGRNDNNKYLSSMEIFNLKSQEWEDTSDTPGINMPIPISRMKVVLVNTSIVVMGGYIDKNNDYNNDIFAFDSDNYKWDRFNGTTMTTVRRLFAAAVLEEDQIYTIGGRDDKGNNLDSIEFSKFEVIPGITNAPSSNPSTATGIINAPSSNPSTATGIINAPISNPSTATGIFNAAISDPSTEIINAHSSNLSTATGIGVGAVVVAALIILAIFMRKRISNVAIFMRKRISNVAIFMRKRISNNNNILQVKNDSKRRLIIIDNKDVKLNNFRYERDGKWLKFDSTLPINVNEKIQINFYKSKSFIVELHDSANGKVHAQYVKVPSKGESTILNLENMIDQEFRNEILRIYLKESVSGKEQKNIKKLPPQYKDLSNVQYFTNSIESEKWDEDKRNGLQTLLHNVFKTETDNELQYCYVFTGLADTLSKNFALGKINGEKMTKLEIGNAASYIRRMYTGIYENMNDLFSDDNAKFMLKLDKDQDKLGKVYSEWIARKYKTNHYFYNKLGSDDFMEIIFSSKCSYCEDTYKCQFEDYKAGSGEWPDAYVHILKTE